MIKRIYNLNKEGTSNRLLAVKVLKEAMVSKTSLKRVYSKHFKESNLSVEDRRFIVEIVKGTMRMSKRLDHEISFYLKKKIHSLEKLYLIILRSAVYQLNYMTKIPDYAVVSTAVDITKHYFPKYKGLTNALLRNVIKKEYDLKRPCESDSIDKVAIYYSHPEWIVDRWIKKIGYSKTIKILNFNNKPPKTWFRYNKKKIELSDIEEVLSQYGQIVTKFKHLDNFFTIDKPSVLLNEKLFSKGYIMVQSPTNGLIVRLLNPRKGEDILDICSAPGGKTLSISESLDDADKLKSYDINPDRIKLIKNNLVNSRINNVQLFEADAAKDSFPNTSSMIIDVPCSGTGTMAKNADLRWRKSIVDISNLANLQEQILNNCSQYLNVGGALVYSTCSIEEEENWMVVNKFLNQNKNYKVDCAKKYVDAEFVDSSGAINVNPSVHDIEGGFAVKLVKNGN